MADFQVMDNDYMTLIFSARVSHHTMNCLYDFLEQFEPEHESLGTNSYQLDIHKLKKEVLKLTLGNPLNICNRGSECTREEVLNDLLSILSNRESGTYYIYYGA